MKTFNLEEAAQFLKMNPEGLRRLAATRKIPGAKPGKCWCFLEEDLVKYIRSLYDEPCNPVSQAVSQSKKRKKHINAISDRSDFRKIEKKYRELLGLLTDSD